MSEDVRVQCWCGAFYEPDESCPACGRGPRTDVPATMAEALDQRDAARAENARLRGDMGRATSAPCTCAYFADVDFTMTDLACPVHGPGGSNPMPDQPGRRDESSGCPDAETGGAP